MAGFPLSLLAQSGAEPQPALSDEEKEEFLLNAEIICSKVLETGVTGSLRATLGDGRLVHDAHIQNVDRFKRTFRARRRIYLNFHDCYKYNIAAYRLDRLIDLNMVPVSVERRVRGKRSAVTWWVDDVMMMDEERYQRRVTPPHATPWNRQRYHARIFNRLVYNSDPNLGNLLITNAWRLWMVDFTRAFRTELFEPGPTGLTRIGRRLWRGLRRLDREALQRETQRYLTGHEIDAVLARRDHILKIFDDRIAEEGEAAVVFEP
jgi:hypothetical protein